MELGKKAGGPMEVDEPTDSPSIVLQSKHLETNNLLSQEEHFIGFDIDDRLSKTLQKKIRLLKMELGKEAGGPIEVDEPTDSPSIIHNNHVNKKKQSKSSISTPRSNDTKKNRSNKRHKNNNKRSETLKSLELYIPSSSGEWQKCIIHVSENIKSHNLFSLGTQNFPIHSH
ncbi:uncharacterized protein LOC132923929 [Rhopalosiphum padi]|uniref:uncharacterized protein LOC132923929 n=1 Tax=Rhopalosiphum padi TaxID=40932 RepID=UPI00298EB15F|nr:uncharacterized protein LOC132923929 [Rhopalosiphum padi]